jgi:Zn-dependent M28 family amino/carboxypeptidase
MIPISCISVVLTATPAAAQTDSSALRQAVTVEAIRTHLEALQEIADANGGTRVAGSPGYDQSARYVEQKLRDAGFQVTVQPFEFFFFSEESPSEVAQTEPTGKTYLHGTDFLTMRLSGAGNIDGLVVPTNDIVIPPDSTLTSTSGCEPTDFSPAPSVSAVALVQRGGCIYQAKATNAAAAGYAAVVIFNEGQEGRRDVHPGTLETPVGIPVLTASFGLGEELYNLTQAGQVRVGISTDTTVETRDTVNVIGEIAGAVDRVLVVGAHLDSVGEGPGLNDNGTGTATILEVALQMKRLGITPTHRIRFAFWGAEEWGLIGSQYYVGQLTQQELGKILLNLNFDMHGSPNSVRFVYDGDGSDGGPVGPNGSLEIERLFLDYFLSQNLLTLPTPFDGRSDYGPFIDKGIAAGGLFSGAEAIKTPDQAEKFGGTAGEAYDRCYHSACDDIANVGDTSLDELGDAAAHAVLHFATVPPIAVVAALAAVVDRTSTGIPSETLPFLGEGQFQR